MISEDPESDTWISKVKDLDPINSAIDRKTFVITGADWAKSRFAKITGCDLNDYISRKDCYWIINRIIRNSRNPPVMRAPAILVCAVISIEYCALRFYRDTDDKK